MTETIEPTTDAVTKVARDLTEIEALAATLDDQAIHKANDRLMPGGLAMVSIAGVANLEAWGNVVDTALRVAYERGDDLPELDDEDEWEPPLQTLCFWSEQWRREHDAEYDQRPTIASEANFIRYLLPWAWDNEVHWDDFARDIRKARLRLENILYAGRRTERSRVRCDAEDCETKPRLVKTYGDDPNGTLDRHKCPACKSRYDADDVNRAYAKQLRSEGAARFVKIGDAVGTLHAHGRSERTVRKWFEECKVNAYCDPRTHEVWVWWPDLWTLHLTTATRRRVA